VKLGVQLPNLGILEGRDAFVRTARAAEELGYDSVWTGDHVVLPVESASPYPYHRGGAYSPDPLIAYDALIALAVVAGCTERVELGTGVLVLPQRNPLLTAKQLASLDSLSNGRVIFGAGAGWFAEEFVALGAPDFELRGEVLEEWVAILRRCWTEDEPRFEGRHYRFDPVHFQPRPARPIPILIGGNSAAALRRAGRIGDGWFGTAVTLDEAGPSIAAVRRSAELAGRDPDRLTLGCGFTVNLTFDERDHARHLMGTPAQVAERIHALAEVGFDHIELRFAPMRDPAGSPLERALEMIEAFAAEVAPAARR
jgi:probable F420-dependent oxidoreductase